MLKKIALLLLLIAPMSVFAQKFAHFRSMDIIQVMPEFAKAQTDIQAMQKQYEAEIKRASDEFSKKFAEYQKEQSTLPQNIQERRQKELQELQEKGMQFQQDAQQQLETAYKRYDGTYLREIRQSHQGCRSGRWLYLCFRLEPYRHSVYQRIII